MVLFQCERCGHTSTVKQSMKRHLIRKKMCNPILNDVTPNIIKLKCKICFREFINIEEYYKHNHSHSVIVSNSVKKIDSLDALKELVNALNNRLDKRDRENEQLRNKDIKNREIIEKLAVKAGITNIDNRRILNITNNFNILPYSETDTTHITEKMKYEFIKGINDEEDIINSVTNLIKDIHFNPEKPENHNAYISNNRENTVMVYDKNTREQLRWEVKEKTPFVQKMIDDNSAIIERWGYEKGKEDKKVKILTEKYHDVRENGENTETKIEKRVGLTMYNEKKMVQNSKKLMDKNYSKDYSSLSLGNF